MFVGLGGVLVCSFLGGMRAVTWTQVAQYLIMILAYLVPVIWLSDEADRLRPCRSSSYGQQLHQHQPSASSELIHDPGELGSDAAPSTQERAEAVRGAAARMCPQALARRTGPGGTRQRDGAEAGRRRAPGPDPGGREAAAPPCRARRPRLKINGAARKPWPSSVPSPWAACRHTLSSSRVIRTAAWASSASSANRGAISWPWCSAWWLVQPACLTSSCATSPRPAWPKRGARSAGRCSSSACSTSPRRRWR